jgi:hypothetical protein
MNLPEDAFVVGMVAANQGSPVMHRKAFPQQFQAFAKFRETHKDAVLYVHTNEYASVRRRRDAPAAVREACGLPRKAVGSPKCSRGSSAGPRQTLATRTGVRRAAERVDGRGVRRPDRRGAGVGVPVIVTDHSAMTELCGAGWLVDGDPWYDPPQDSWFKSPSVDGDRRRARERRARPRAAAGRNDHRRQRLRPAAGVRHDAARPATRGSRPDLTVASKQRPPTSPCFLNNDIEVRRSRMALRSLVAAVEPGVLAGARLRNDAHGSVDGHPFPYLDGWCLAGIRADLLEIGGFDETFDEPAYYSDNDLCLRARIAGMRLRECPVGLLHKENRTAGHRLTACCAGSLTGELSAFR